MATPIQRTKRRLADQAARKRTADTTMRKQRTVRGNVIAPNLVQVRGAYYDAEFAGATGQVTELVNVGRASRAFYRPAANSAALPITGRAATSAPATTPGQLVTVNGYDISHSQLRDLAIGDDHPHYLNIGRGDALYYRQSFIDAHIADPNAHHDQLHEMDNGLHHRLTDAGPYTFVGTGISGGPTVERHIASHNAQQNPLAILKALNGAITLEELTTVTQLITPQITSPDGSYLDLDPPLDIRTANTLRSYNWFSGLVGAGINFATGNADFRKITVDELYADAFTAMVTKALAGAVIITKSMSRVAKAFTIPPVGQSAPLQIWDIPGFAGMDAFEIGDEVMLPFFQIGDITPTAPDPVYIRSTTITGGEGTTGGGDIYLDQDFSSSPSDWYDSAVNNSLVQDDSLFSAVAGAWRTTGSGSNFHTHWVGSGATTLTDYRYTGRFRMGATTAGVGLTFYSDYPSSDSYYRIRRYSSAQTLHIASHGATTGPNSGTTNSGYNPGSYAAGTWHHFKIEVENSGSQTLIRAKFWPETGSEPTTWQIDCYDSTANRYTAGTIGMWGYDDGSGVDYDDVIIESLAPATTINTTLYIDKPANTASGDLLVLAVTHDTTATISAAGFTFAGSGSQNGKKLTVLSKIAGTSEPSTYTISAGSPDDVGATLTAFRNVGNAPIGDIQFQSGNSTTFSTGGLYPTLDNSMSMYIVATMNTQVLPASPAQVSYSGETGTLSAESRIAVYYLGDQDVGVASGAYQFNYASAQDYVFAELMINSSPGGSPGGSVAIGRAWATVSKYTTDPEDLIDGAQMWKATIATNTSAEGFTILPDAPVLDYGVDGDGVVEITTLDPNGAPYVRAFYRGQHAWDTTAYDVIFQAGNIDGTPALGVDGFYTKQKSGAGTGSIEISDAGSLIDDVPFRQKYSGKTKVWFEELRARFGQDVASGLTAFLVDYATGDVTLGREGAGGYAKWDESAKKLDVRGEIHLYQGSQGYDNLADGSTYGKVRNTILGGGYIVIGSGTKDSTLDGWSFGPNDEIVGQLDGVDQVVLNLSGEIAAGIDRVHLNRDGIRVDVSSGLLTTRRYSFYYPGTATEIGYIAGKSDNLISGYPSQVIIAARGANGGRGDVWLYGYGASDSASNFGYGSEPYYGGALGVTYQGVKVRAKGLLIDTDGLHNSQVPAGQLRVTADYDTWAQASAEASTGAILFGTQSYTYGPFGGGHLLLRQTQSTNPTTPAGFGAIYFSGAGNTLVVKFPDGTIRGIALT